MGKRKLTLVVDEDVLREVRSIFAIKGVSISEAVEEFLESALASRWLEELADTLGYGKLIPLDPSRISEDRPSGIDAAKFVRELRDKREER